MEVDVSERYNSRGDYAMDAKDVRREGLACLVIRFSLRSSP